MVDIICATIAAISAFIVAIITNRSKKDRAMANEQYERREKENRISMSLMFATSKLCTVTAMAMKNHGETGTELDEALHAVSVAQQEYEKFLMDTTAHQVAK